MIISFLDYDSSGSYSVQVILFFNLILITLKKSNFKTPWWKFLTLSIQNTYPDSAFFYASCGEFVIHFKFSFYLLRNLVDIESSWAGRENMLLSAVAQEDILSEKWVVWSGPAVAIKNPRWE